MTEERQSTNGESEKKLQTYLANCHCGKVRIIFQHGRLESEMVVCCNCSICTKNGYILTYPQANDVEIRSGADEMGEYLFASREKPHRFCRTCGSAMLIDFTQSSNAMEKQLVAINVRMIAGVEEMLPELPMKMVKGMRAVNGPYEPQHGQQPSR